jgi:large subunit ribosomal protein L24
MQKIKQGDEVVVIAGKDKGKQGKVLKVLRAENSNKTRLLVEGANRVKKHRKANPQANIEGAIIDKEAPLHISNVAIVNGVSGKADRVGFKRLEDGTKVRIYKSNQEVIAEPQRS